MNATLERVKLPGYKRESVVYVRKLQGKTAGKTKYVRKGGEWVTLTRAMKVKKGGVFESEYCTLRNQACLEMQRLNGKEGLIKCELIPPPLIGDLTAGYLKELNNWGMNNKTNKKPYNSEWLRLFKVKGKNLNINAEILKTLQDNEIVMFGDTTKRSCK